MGCMALQPEPCPESGVLPLRHRDGDASKLCPVPNHLRQFLAPAEWFIYEWTPYIVELNGATLLKVGSLWHPPIAPGVFQITFENQLGLSAIRAYDADGPIGRPFYVEVVARKFVDPSESVAFLRQTLADLFARVSSSPFVLGGLTERMVREAQAPPNTLFAFHFYRHYGADLIRSLQAIQGRPHQQLAATSELVQLHEVRRVEQESMVRMLLAGHASPSMPTEHLDRMTPLQRLSPERVWQNTPIETFDTSENRFVLSVCRRMLVTIHLLRRAAWYATANIDAATRRRIDQAAEHLAGLTMDARFAALGPMVNVPVHSRVLQRRDGYHELAKLWNLFQRSRQPMFEQMQSAIDLRNIADLYEFWVWFELLERVREITGTEATYEPVPGDFGVPGWKSRAMFEKHGKLHYNRGFRGYSGISLRPDYVWEHPDGSLTVMDAKFRMQTPADLIDNETSEGDTNNEQRAKDDDLQKVHTYRDAIPRVKAAVVLYPGDVSVFRSPNGDQLEITLAGLLEGNMEGIGAIPMNPVATFGTT